MRSRLIPFALLLSLAVAVPEFFASDDCSGSGILEAKTDSAAGATGRFRALAAHATAPAEARAAAVSLNAAGALFDDVFV